MKTLPGRIERPTLAYHGTIGTGGVSRTHNHVGGVDGDQMRKNDLEVVMYEVLYEACSDEIYVRCDLSAVDHFGTD